MSRRRDDLIQFDAALDPEDSEAPLLNVQAEVLTDGRISVIAVLDGFGRDVRGRLPWDTIERLRDRAEREAERQYRETLARERDEAAAAAEMRADAARDERSEESERVAASYERETDAA